MRIAYLDCFAGISGDMLLGALVDAGVPRAVLEEATAALQLGANLKIGTADRSGISATKVDVYEGEVLAEAVTVGHSHSHAESGSHSHSHEGSGSHSDSHAESHTHSHTHGGGTHTHDHHEEATHTHVHGRSLTQIRELIGAAALSEAVKRTSLRAFELLGQSEAKIHNVPVEQIHFHEVGAVDAIVDIVAASAGLDHLGVDAWYCSPLNVGGGMVVCAHGTFPVPAPATADLLRGVPTYSAHIQGELVTPTGAALVRALAPTFGPQPAMQVERIGYGAGTRNPKDFPNVLRISVGEAAAGVSASFAGAHEQVAGESAHRHEHPQREHARHEGETVTVLETALDDLSPQVLAYVAEKALAEGALDVMLTPVVMKKGRPGTLLTVLSNPSDSHKLERLILRETSTLGVRMREDRRSCLQRQHAAVETPYGEIRVKIGTLGDEVLNAAPEFEDCRRAAAEHGVPLKEVQGAALAAYREAAVREKMAAGTR